MTQLLRGLLAGCTFLTIFTFLSLLLFNRQQAGHNQPVEKEECPFAQEDYIYWSKKHKLAWCKVPKAGSTTWVYNMLQLAKNTSSSAPPDARQQPYSTPQSTERAPDGLLLHAPQIQLSEDDLMHEELRRHYPVPKSFNEVEKQALTFHVVRHPLERLLSAYRDKLESGNNTHYYPIFGKVTWRQFVNLVLSTPAEKLDEHWRPISLLCSPCITWQQIIRMEQFAEDSEFLLARKKLSLKLASSWRHKHGGHGERSKFELERFYYSKLTVSEVEGLVQIYSRDFSLYNYSPEAYLWMAAQAETQE